MDHNHLRQEIDALDRELIQLLLNASIGDPSRRSKA